ncbi:conjugal transfer protein TraN [Aliarcobacter butzleri]|uniref:conjugal transfer protein TraN n=1 Tax=Aliarcobacter butzleri TaxID=28197 RepID=UPI0021B4C043|nr:conjugal transfer protein TraN [Aliarcobacter butzleri]MCT7595109.1 conjugal transfer protein TraN [Aliarcobacter butzleri]MCT7603454.1 conjugal transfer protein TraN [Aliarcobacter butzleri]
MSSKILILLFVGIISLLNAESKCTDIKDLKQHNGHYYGITTNTMTFDEAKKFAESKGGYLAIPNNAAENNFLKSILGGRNGAWIGIYDPNYSSNYSYSKGQKINPSRFKDIKGNSLSYSYWESTQPDNFVDEYDAYDGKQMVSPLGEHWVAMDGNSGKWWDYGNHLGTGNAKFYVLLEFDSTPTCFEDLSSSVTDTFTNKKCSTQIWDDKTGNLETGTIFDCRTDTYGNTYCPSALSQCGEQWDYENGYAVSGVGQVVDYTNKESSSGGGAEVIGTVEYQYRGNGSGIDMFFRTTGAGYNKTNYIKKSSSWILDENTQSGWAGDILGELSGMYSIYGCDSGGVLKYKSHNNNTMTVYMECVKENCDYPATKQNIHYGTYSLCSSKHAIGASKILNINGNTVRISSSKSSSFATINGSKENISGPGNSFSNSGITVTKLSYEYNAGGSCHYKNTFSVYYEALTCPNGGTLSGTTCKKSCNNVTKCPVGYTETTGSETAKGECKRTVEYTYYNYLCNNSQNGQGFNFNPINSGGNCNKSDPDNTTNNSTTLTEACNSSTPPINNCKRQKFTCQANKDRPCSFVDNSWQCSPFPCVGGNDIVPEGDVEGANDKNNNGWNEDGMCNGQIYIFNGKDRRCRSWDMFFGLVGGGCCDKDKVFMGLVGCKENEKMLAKQNKAELCTEIGEYCSKKLSLGFTKICIQKSKGHCCFGSKLARFVHEQGRSQIGIDWGSAESPQCRGFTPEEFQKLDFSKIDLTGAFDIPEINQSDLTNKINSTVENFKNMLGNNN